ncbi:MAG: hypothetical protein ACYCV6_08655 [Steroidobacteraceae bacterium]
MEETTLSRHFSAGEIARLERDLPRLDHWSRSLLVPFTAYRIRSASVAWLNPRWFLERGFNLAQERTLRQVSEWLVEEFAWCVQSGSDGVTADIRTLWADRYGSTQGRSPHGGSGRVATVGCFQAKGIGPTPLVGQGDKPGHSHGCLSLEECLREAIYAEIMAAEFPHGAVPTIAILDTGLHFSSPEPDQLYDQNARRGILIRPAVVRPAHAERAPLFKRPTGDFRNNQAADVQRTRDVIAHWMSAAGNETGMNGAMEALEALVRAMVQQIAFGQVQRLFSGGYFSSNVSIRGELLDFGNTHALPNWVHAHVLRLDPGFGEEMELIRPLIGSLSFYFAKYHGRGDLRDLENRAERVWTLAKETYARTWKHYALSLFHAAGLDGRTREGVHSVLLEYFRSQQRHRVTYLLGISRAHSTLPATGWLYDALLEDQSLPSTEENALRRIAEFLKSHDRSTLYLAGGTAARLLRPRPSIDRRHLLDTLAAAVPRGATQGTVDSCAIARLVQHTISAARRHWPRLREGYVVLAHASSEGSSALLCATHPEGPRTVWAEGIRDDSGELQWFGRRIAVSEFPQGVHLDETYWCAMCPAHEAANGVWHVRLADGEMAVPTWDVEYARPAKRWIQCTDAETAISADTPSG